MPVRRGALTTDMPTGPTPRPAAPARTSRDETSPVRIIALLLVVYGAFTLWSAAQMLAAPLPPSMLRAKAMCAEAPAVASDPCAKFDVMEARIVSGGRRSLAIGAVVLLLAGGLFLRSSIARGGVIVVLGAGIVSKLSFLASRAEVAARPELGGIVRWQVAEQCAWIAVMVGLIYVLSSARVRDEFRADGTA